MGTQCFPLFGSLVVPHAGAGPPPSSSRLLFYSSAGPGKRSSREAITTPGQLPSVSTLSSSRSGSLSLFCRNVGRPFLVDSGADVSVYPASPSTLSGRASGSLHAANGSTINTYGSLDLLLNFGALKVSHSFLLAEVSKPILGSDFFIRHRLLIDLAGRAVKHQGRRPFTLSARRASASSILRPQAFPAAVNDLAKVDQRPCSIPFCPRRPGCV